MNILTAESLAKAYRSAPLFCDLNISININEKAALIGTNGSGKSTLLKILAGHESPDSGKVTVRGGLRIGYLEQVPEFDEAHTVKESIFQSTHPVLNLLGEYEKLLEEGEKADIAALQRVSTEIDAMGAWNTEHHAREILSKLEIHDLNKPVKFLSGGERRRVALTRLLITHPDLLLLDEPTNHLDLDMIEWLEDYLKSLNKSMILVTHDRYFLDMVCNKILQLENGRIFSYAGNYTWYLQKQQERKDVQAAEIDRAVNLYKRELEWMRKQPKARTTKQKARIDSFYETEKKVKSEKTETELNISMQMERMGSKILEMEYVCKSFGEKKIAENFIYTFKRGEKAGIIGRNGSGKTTFLKMILGLEKPDKGKIRKGETIRFGYYSQDGMKLNEDLRVIDVVREIAEYVEVKKDSGKWMSVTRLLNHFKFSNEKQQTFIKNLSGGEKRRLYLLMILIRNPNFLILDEPTNDFDINTLNVLEDYLEGYEGCILLVTHDRYLMDRVAEHVFVFEGDGKIRDVPGNYTDYHLLKEMEQKSIFENKLPHTTKITDARKSAAVPIGLSFKERRELEYLEKELEALEQKKMKLIEAMNNTSSGFERISEISRQFNETEKLIESKSARWIELTEKMIQN